MEVLSLMAAGFQLAKDLLSVDEELPTIHQVDHKNGQRKNNDRMISRC